MNEVDQLISQFGGKLERYLFYNGDVILFYDPAEHLYYRLMDDELAVQDGTTTVCHIIDKSHALIPWACKMMAAKLLTTVEPFVTADGVGMPYPAFEQLVLSAKKAHEEKLEDAADVGSKAHNWIERYIKAVIDSDYGGPPYVMFPLPEDERAANCVRAALDWMTQHKVRWVATERKIYSREYGYAGTEDGKAYVSSCGGPCCPQPFTQRLSLIDWKSSNYLYTEYLLQTAAYMHADVEELGTPIEDRWVIRLGKEDAKFDPWHLEGEELFHEDFAAFLTALSLYRSVHTLEARVKQSAAAIRAVKKAQAKADKAQALKIKCSGADKYKGVRPPRCKGNPCQTCLAKYADRHSSRNKAGTIGSDTVAERLSTEPSPAPTVTVTASVSETAETTPCTSAPSVSTGTWAITSTPKANIYA